MAKTSIIERVLGLKNGFTERGEERFTALEQRVVILEEKAVALEQSNSKLQGTILSQEEEIAGLKTRLTVLEEQRAGTAARQEMSVTPASQGEPKAVTAEEKAQESGAVTDSSAISDGDTDTRATASAHEEAGGTPSERDTMHTPAEDKTSPPDKTADSAASRAGETGGLLADAGEVDKEKTGEASSVVTTSDLSLVPLVPSATASGVGHLPAPAAGTNADSTDTAKEATVAARQVFRAEAIARTLARDEKRLAEDLQLCGEHKAEAHLWLDRATRLRDGIQQAEQICQEKAKDGANILSSLSEEIRTALKGRQEGIELVGGKMLAQAQMIKLQETDQPGELKPALTEEEIGSRLGEEADSALVDERLVAMLEEASSEGYAVVSAWRIFARDAQRAFVSHVANTVIPAIEGLDSGERNAEEVVAQLSAADPASQVALQAWYRTYDLCRHPVLEALKAIDIHQMQIQKGKMPDYMRHRAGAVEESDLEDEAILSVQRNGYEMIQKEQPVLVIREAWVVVSKKREG